MLDSSARSVPSVPYRHVPRRPSGVEASAGLPVAPIEPPKPFMLPTDSSIAAEMSRLFSGWSRRKRRQWPPRRPRLKRRRGWVPPAPSEVAASEVSHASPELAAEQVQSEVQLEGEESSVNSYNAAPSGTEIGEVEGPSVTGVKNEPSGSLVTPIESLTDESSDSQYTIGPTQLDVDDSVAINFAGSPAADLHSPLENAPEPPPMPTLAAESHPGAELAEAPAVAAAPPVARLDIDAAVMEAAVKRVLERIEPHLHEILSNGVLRPLIENALHKELEKK